tara:strand:+ start:12706 stop:13371 length:666 start_codon:yes stop_codon:yes gene_type:complete
MQAKYLDHMGGDLAVVQAAKVSFADDATVQMFIDDIEADLTDTRSHEALIRYLATHNHWTPFAHAVIKLRMRAPVPIRTQCFKHKQGFVENEESRRYISDAPELFIPDFFRSKPVGSIKQGSADKHEASDLWLARYRSMSELAIGRYMDAVAAGICPEQARFFLPQGCQVNWVWTGSLAAFARFYKQRTDSHAQVEIQQLAKAVGELIQPLFPYSWKYLTK